MIDRLTAETQARLAYFIIIGHFVLKAAAGFGLTIGGTDELAMLAAAFFFMRQRQESKSNAP